jgi:predicted nucleic acid-binding protein
MKTIPFLDTNVLLRHLLADHPEQSPKATEFLARIERGDVTVRTSELVVFELVFTLQRQYHQPRSRIRAAVLSLLELPGIVLPGKRRFRRVFDLYTEANLPFADAYHVVLMERLKTQEVASFDQHFDRIPGIRRLAW